MVTTMVVTIKEAGRACIGPRRTPTPVRSARGAAQTSERVAAAAALAAVLIWALIPVGTRYFVQRVDPLMFNLVRFAASGTAALPLFLHARPWRWPAGDQARLALAALLAVPGYNIPVALAAQTIPAGELGLLIATEPVFIVAFMVLLEHRRVGRRTLGGGALALAGVLVTSGVLKMPRHFQWPGALEVLGGAASWSLYTVLAGRLNARYGTFGVTGAILIVGTAALAALSVPVMHAGSWPDPPTVAALAAMGIASSMLGFLLWNHACAHLAAERVGLYLYLIPILCLAGGALVLGERLTASILAGGTLTIIGVWIASPRSGATAAAAESRAGTHQPPARVD
jgi:drug/metabolite transporter (DMT)-like permease